MEAQWLEAQWLETQSLLKVNIMSKYAHLRVHPTAGPSPGALKCPSKQGHSQTPTPVVTVLEGQDWHVLSESERCIPAGQAVG